MRRRRAGRGGAAAARHPRGDEQHASGQGTACRRFFFANAYLELVWVENDADAGAGEAKRTRLLERWAMRRAGACPFGLIMRQTVEEADTRPAFPTWRYAPSYFPEGFAIEVAEGTSIAEPEIFYFPFRRAHGMVRAQPLDHAVPATSVHRVTIAGPVPDDLSAASREVVAFGAVRFEEALVFALTIDFRTDPDASADLRPDLPLILRW